MKPRKYSLSQPNMPLDSLKKKKKEKAKTSTCGSAPKCFISLNKAVGDQHLHIFQHDLIL